MKLKSILAISLASALLSACGSPNSLNTSDDNSVSIQSKDKNYIPIGTSTSEWGLHSQIGATYEEMIDLKGNNDGIWENEKESRGTVKGIGTILPLKPWFEKKSQALKAELSTTNVIKELTEFQNQQEKKWGKSVTSLSLSKLNYGKLFSVQKSIYLARMERNPSTVTEGFITAKGSVNGVTINARDIFWQRFKPTNKANGKVVVVSPGFQETGRNFYEQIEKISAKGYDVIAMDQQWGGQTKGGQPGGLDRGFGVARDVAAVAAFANQIVNKEYNNVADHEVILFGNSMGAGPGVLGALVLNDNGKIKLEGDQMPVGLNAVLQAPFLSTSESLLNSAIGLFSKTPVAKNLQLYSSGLPILTHDKTAAQKGTQVSILEDIRAQLSAMTAANKDIDTITNMIKSGETPQGNISIVHGKSDPLADSSKSIWLANQLGNKAKINVLNSNNHVLEQSPSEQDYAVTALFNLK